ncbi:hypothetical protein [Kamptonema formosum]|uniref:hypothetical protein n=1 Tax=Kamptonema formosum TaxID=331992 RepID=UPI000344DF71|nr:hypothetical protein [Oscillatoria sp. PCC 10802]
MRYILLSGRQPVPAGLVRQLSGALRQCFTKHAGVRRSPQNPRGFPQPYAGSRSPPRAPPPPSTGCS